MPSNRCQRKYKMQGNLIIFHSKIIFTENRIQFCIILFKNSHHQPKGNWNRSKFSSLTRMYFRTFSQLTFINLNDIWRLRNFFFFFAMKFTNNMCFYGKLYCTSVPCTNFVCLFCIFFCGTIFEVHGKENLTANVH